MITKKLFLLGGSPAVYEIYADAFVAAAGGEQAVLVVLGQSLAGWEKFGEEITRPWIKRGVQTIIPVTPDAKGFLDREKIAAIIRQTSGIFICGGHTPTYYDLYATGLVRTAIQERYAAGVPVAGISAGALISMEHCQLTTEETGQDLRMVPGLGLAAGFVIGVHYSEWAARAEVLAVMAETFTAVGYGIDETACLVCEDGKVCGVLGQSIYRLSMTDFDQKDFEEQVWEGKTPK